MNCKSAISLKQLLGLSLVCVLLCFACEKQVIEPTPFTPTAQSARIQVSEDALLQGMIATLTGYSPAGRVQEAAFGNIMLAEAVKVTEPELEVTLYTLALEQENPLMWSNLVLREVEGQVKGYVIEFWPELSWLKTQTSSINMSDFEGVWGVKSLSGTPLFAAYLENGLSTRVKSYTTNTRLMCDEPGGDGGYGGGSGGSWGDFGDVGDAGSGDAGSPSGGTDSGGSGVACIQFTSTLTGNILWDCPGVGIVGTNLRVQCEDNGDETGGGGASGSNGPTTIGTMEPVLLDPIYIEAEEFERKIDSTELDECIQKVLAELLRMPDGIGMIVRKFAGEQVDYNWDLKMGQPLNDRIIAVTKPEYDFSTNTATTTFNPRYFEEATDLAIAKTLLHEAAHAYLVSYYWHDPIIYQYTYQEMIDDKKVMKEGEAQHEEIVRSFIQNIAHSLAQYGKAKGYTMNADFYVALAWGGLQETKLFNQLPLQEQYRIENVVKKEQEGYDRWGASASPKGTPANCGN